MHALSRVTPATLAPVSAAALALLIGCLIVLWRNAFARAEPGTPGVAIARLWPPALWMAALFLGVFAAKLLLMRDNPVTSPYWDQWDAEARRLYIPFNAGDLSWREMFSLHNEHRIFFSRLLALDLLAINRQWDPRLQQVVNASMHALTAVCMAAMFWRTNDRRGRAVAIIGCAAAFALPFAWDNILVGFQSAFYFLVLFSTLALWLTTSFRPGSGPWWLGWTSATAALFASAGGPLTALAMLAVAILKVANDPLEWRDFLKTLAPAAVVLGLGVATASPPVPYHEPLKAHSAHDFLGALARELAWPWTNHPLMALLMWSPVVLLLVAATRRRLKTTEGEQLIVAMAGWVLLNAATVAYARGAGATGPATRYMDFLSLGFLANAIACVALLDRARAPASRLGAGSLAVWLLLAVAGIERLTANRLTGSSPDDLGLWRHYFVAHAANVRRFVIAGDRDAFVAKRPAEEIPYPDPRSLAITLEDPYIRRILPAAVRQPLRVEPQVITNNAFVMDAMDGAVAPSDLELRTWSSADRDDVRGRFESQALVCQLLGGLKFQVLRDLRDDAPHLVVRDLRTGEELAVDPTRQAGGAWSEAVVPCPSNAFQLVAASPMSASRFSFREPVEVGWGSLGAEWLIARSQLVLITALTMAGVAVLLDIRHEA